VAFGLFVLLPFRLPFALCFLARPALLFACAAAGVAVLRLVCGSEIFASVNPH